MRLPELLLIASLGFYGCADSLQAPPTKWTTGFWFWQGSSAGVSASQTVDVLFFHAGTIRRETWQYGRTPWSVGGQLPDELPRAREYWLLFRFEGQGVPDPAVASILARRIVQLRETARQRHLDVAGVQLDIDSPTSALPQYANFLRQLRQSLPSGIKISITALLDWFRDGTAITHVIREVDEFVPQFYDTTNPDSHGVNAIAAKIDTSLWAPRFNRF